MLFDLRGRGRRRTIQVIYLFLAVIMAVGLIGFGIGGATNGGWIDSLFGGGGSSSSSSNDVFQKRVDQGVAKLKANPDDQATLAAMVTNRYNLAQELASESKGNESNAQLDMAARTWQRYLKLNPKPVDDGAARTAVNIYAVLSKPDQAVAAQEYVIDASGDQATYQQYATLFEYAFAAGQTRKADLAYNKALALAPSKDSRAQIKTTMDQFKAQQSSTTTTPATGSTTGQ